MQFVRLGPRYSTTYLPDGQLIEGYNSLVWTERFETFGDFELKSFDVARLQALLPEDTLVSHLETREVMQVETHEINMVGEGVDAQPEITIRGRSAENIFEHRWVESTYQKKRRMRRRYTGLGAAAVLMFQAVDNATGKDVTRGDTDPDTRTEQNDYSWNTRDAIPNVAITRNVSTTTASRWWLLEKGMLYPQLQKILDQVDLGIRTLRPVPGVTVTTMQVRATLADRGELVQTSGVAFNGLQFNIYEGVDRSNSVKFSLLQGHLSNPKYLRSTKDYKTVVEMMSGEIPITDVYRPGESTLSGWRRKTTSFDAGTPEIPDPPEKPDELRKNATKAQKEARADAMDRWIDAYARWKNKRARIIEDFREENSLAALRQLKKQRKTNIFSGDVTEHAPYVYGDHYGLGDTVLLVDGAGASAKMVVSEFVRTEDTNGDRGFPTLVEP